MEVGEHLKQEAAMAEAATAVVAMAEAAMAEAPPTQKGQERPMEVGLHWTSEPPL